MLSICEKADFVKMSSKIVGDNDDIANYSNLAESKVLFSGSTHDYVTKYGLNVGIITTLYRTDFLHKNSIRFEACAVGEDVLFNARCYVLDANVVYTDAIVYAYYTRLTSVSHLVNKRMSERIIRDYTYISREFDQLKNTYPDFSSAFDTYISIFQNIAFSKLLHTTDANISELNQLIALGYKGEIFPLKKNSYKDIAKNVLLSNPWLLKLVSKICNRL